MSFQRLSRQLQRDLKANRKKAAMLGVLALVAGWFWYPLVFKPKPGDAAAPVAAVASVPVSSTTPTTVVASGSKDTRLAWQDLSRWMTDDPQMQPYVPRDGELRNPFQDRTDSKIVEPEPEPAVPSFVGVEPSDLGLVLTSTAVGRNKRFASISGQRYEEGSNVPTSAGVAFKLKRVKPSQVILEHDDQQITLNIK